MKLNNSWKTQLVQRHCSRSLFVHDQEYLRVKVTWSLSQVKNGHCQGH